MNDWNAYNFSEEQEALPVAHCKVNRADLTDYYGSATNADLRDLIIYVRERFPNPYQKVVIETDMKLNEQAFKPFLIYISGVNDNEVNSLTGISGACYLPVKLDQESLTKPGFGLDEAISAFVNSYNIMNFEILLYGSDFEVLSKVWGELQGNPSISYRMHIPASVSTQFRLFKNGLDVSVYVEKFNAAKRRNSLTTGYIGELMNEMRQQVRDGKVAIQDLEQVRSEYARWITFVLTQEFGLSPVYLRAYLSEYVDYEIAYPFKKLSFFERLSFVNALPEHIGYIGKAPGFYCRYQVYQKIYPHPSLVFDVASGEMITDDLERFELTKGKVIDWRTRFPGSKSYLVGNQTGIATSGNDDASVDSQLAEIFLQMTERSNRENVFFTVRNCAQMVVNGKLYVVYFNEPFGLIGSLQSPLFGVHPYAMEEENFKQLIDVRMILAVESKENASDSSAGQEAFTNVLATTARTMRTAIPTYLLMLSEIAVDVNNELSYYDKRLRRDPCIVPIVTHVDSSLRRDASIFDYLNYGRVKRDRIASGFISAFGSLNTMDGNNQKLPVSIDSFRGCKLLE